MRELLVFAVLLIGVSQSIVGAEPVAGPEAVEVKVSVGTADGQHRFVPSELAFERGKYYKLLLHNPGKEDHYFTSEALSTHVFTRKVEVLDAAGNTIAEVHGGVNDLELKPGATVAWYFYPMTKGENLRLYCHKEGHEAGGMTGTISITGALRFAK